MTALDTNVLVRLLTGDDPAQAAVAEALVRSGPTTVSVTVMLELEWVLRAAYGFTPTAISRAFLTLLGIPELHIEQAQVVARAVGCMVDGMDFGDALHLALCRASTFATFDRRLAAKAPGGRPVVRLLEG